MPQQVGDRKMSINCTHAAFRQLCILLRSIGVPKPVKGQGRQIGGADEIGEFPGKSVGGEEVALTPVFEFYTDYIYQNRILIFRCRQSNRQPAVQIYALHPC